MSRSEPAYPARVSRIAVFILAAQLIPLLAAPLPPLQDLPNWAFQARVLNDLVAEAPMTAADYRLMRSPVPNSILTWALAAGGRIMPYVWAAKLLTVLSPLAFFAAYVFFVRRINKAPVPWAEVLGALFAVGHFFWMGFLNFQIGAALGFFLLGYLAADRPPPRPSTWLVIAGAFTALYFCHFLAWCAFLPLVAVVLLRDETQRPRRVTPFLLSLTPSLFMAFWYAMDRAGAFVFRYEYGSALHWAWYKAGPFTFAGGFYPVTPEWTQWIVAAANLVLVPLFALLVLAILVKNFGRRASPFLAPALLLIALGLFGPTRFFEVVRPGERLLYIGVLVLLGTTPWTRLFTAFPRRLAGAAVAISLLNGAGAYHAGSVAAELVRTLNVFALPGEPVLMIADRHSGFRRAELEGDRARRPYSYPNWVFALKYAPFWHLVEKPGPAPTLFPSGVIRLRPGRLPGVDSLGELADPTHAGAYGTLVATGTEHNLDDIERASRRTFPRARWRAGDYFIAAAGP